LFEHPPKSLNPSGVTSKPELDDRFVVVSIVDNFTPIESSSTKIPKFGFALRITSPGPVPVDDKPDPAIMDVTTKDPAFRESSNVPPLPFRRFISFALAVISVPDK